MDAITNLASGDRRARIVLACLADPGDSVTGALVRKVGAVETVGVLDSATELPGMGEVEAGL